MFTKSSQIDVFFEKINAKSLEKNIKTIDFYYKYKYNDYIQIFLEE